MSKNPPPPPYLSLLFEWMEATQGSARKKVLVYICMNVCMHVSACMYVCMCMYVCLYACIYVYVCMQKSIL